MKVTIKGGANLDSLLIVRQGEQGNCYVQIDGERYTAAFSMPKGDGILEINTGQDRG